MPGDAADSWEEWQREYRFGVVLIFPPERVRSVVDGLRAKHDPRSHASCAAHISLTVPLPRAVDDEALREFADVLSQRAPIRIRYGPPMVYPSHPGVVLAVEPQDALAQLVADLEAAPPFRGATPRRWPFSAHMTIAEFVTWGESGEILRTLPSDELVGEFDCAHLSVAVPGDAFRFTERHRLSFAGGAGDRA